MIAAMVDRLSLPLVPDELWALVEPLIPAFEPRPQDGGTAPLDARAVFIDRFLAQTGLLLDPQPP
jgi:hypothetical protein